MKVNEEKPLKIVIVVSYAYPFVGSGLGTVAVAQAETFSKLGLTVTLVSANIPRGPQSFSKNGVSYLKLSALDLLHKFHIPVPFILPNRAFFRAVSQADFVLVHDMLYPSSLIALLVAAFFRKKKFLFQHIGFLDYKNTAINLLQHIVTFVVGKPVVWLADRVLVLTEQVAAYINTDRKKIFLTINGVDTELFAPVESATAKRSLRQKHGIDPDKPVVLFVGRLVPKKGFKLLVKCRAPEYQLVFVGTGTVPAHMKDVPGTYFMGGKTHAELAELYQLSDLFVLPSYGEGFPLSIQEALACGVPVITTNTPEYRELVGDSAISYIPLQEAALKTAISTLIADQQKRTQMAKAARELAIKNFSWEHQCKQIIDSFRTINK